jgi:hypothetical protein
MKKLIMVVLVSLVGLMCFVGCDVPVSNVPLNLQPTIEWDGLCLPCHPDGDSLGNIDNCINSTCHILNELSIDNHGDYFTIVPPTP